MIIPYGALTCLPIEILSEWMFFFCYRFTSYFVDKGPINALLLVLLLLLLLLCTTQGSRNNTVETGADVNSYHTALNHWQRVCVSLQQIVSLAAAQYTHLAFYGDVTCRIQKL